MASPVLADRHGFLLRRGDQVESLAHNAIFTLHSFQTYTHAYPTVFLVKGTTSTGKRIEVDASLTMKYRPPGDISERAAFCERCFNHYYEEAIYKHICPWAVARRRRKRRHLAVVWCIPRFLRWKHRALKYFQGRLEALLVEGVAAHNDMQLE